MGSFDKSSDPEAVKTAPVAVSDNDGSVGEVQAAEKFAFGEDRKIGITGAVFLILNKMIGTGIFSTPSAIFAATGSVGVSLFLWIIGKLKVLINLASVIQLGNSHLAETCHLSPWWLLRSNHMPT